MEELEMVCRHCSKRDNCKYIEQNLDKMNCPKYEDVHFGENHNTNDIDDSDEE